MDEWWKTCPRLTRVRLAAQIALSDSAQRPSRPSTPSFPRLPSSLSDLSLRVASPICLIVIANIRCCGFATAETRTLRRPRAPTAPFTGLHHKTSVARTRTYQGRRRCSVALEREWDITAADLWHYGAWAPILQVRPYPPPRYTQNPPYNDPQALIPV